MDDVEERVKQKQKA